MLRLTRSGIVNWAEKRQPVFVADHFSPRVFGENAIDCDMPAALEA